MLYIGGMVHSTDPSFDAFEGLLIGVAGGVALWLSLGATFWLLLRLGRIF